MSSNSTHNLIPVILWLGIIFFIPLGGVSAQPVLKEQNKIKDFGKSLKKFEKKEKGNFRAAGNAEDEETIRVKTDLVVNDVLVVNQKGNAILGLKQSDFVITEDGLPQEVGLFSFGENATVPRSIVLIFDYSTSLSSYIRSSVEAGKLLIDNLAPQDRMAIVTDDVKLLVNFTKDKELLKKTLDSLEKKNHSGVGGDSKQYSALMAVLNEMFDEEDIRPIIIWQTDGDEIVGLKVDNDAIPFSAGAREMFYRTLGRRPFGFSDVKEAVEKSRATIYSIIPGMRFIGHSKEEQLKRADIYQRRMIAAIYQRQISNLDTTAKRNTENLIKQYQAETADQLLLTQQALVDVSKLSGGYTDYLEKPEDAKTVYSTIFSVINNRYIVGYYPGIEVKNGKRHNVKIEIRNHPEYIVMGRKTYLAAEQ